MNDQYIYANITRTIIICYNTYKKNMYLEFKKRMRCSAQKGVKEYIRSTYHTTLQLIIWGTIYIPTHRPRCSTHRRSTWSPGRLPPRYRPFLPGRRRCKLRFGQAATEPAAAAAAAAAHFSRRALCPRRPALCSTTCCHWASRHPSGPMTLTVVGPRKRSRRLFRAPWGFFL